MRAHRPDRPPNRGSEPECGRSNQDALGGPTLVIGIAFCIVTEHGDGDRDCGAGNMPRVGGKFGEPGTDASIAHERQKRRKQVYSPVPG